MEKPNNIHKEISENKGEIQERMTPEISELKKKTASTVKEITKMLGADPYLKPGERIPKKRSRIGYTKVGGSGPIKKEEPQDYFGSKDFKSYEGEKKVRENRAVEKEAEIIREKLEWEGEKAEFMQKNSDFVDKRIAETLDEYHKKDAGIEKAEEEPAEKKEEKEPEPVKSEPTKQPEVKKETEEEKQKSIELLYRKIFSPERLKTVRERQTELSESIKTSTNRDAIEEYQELKKEEASLVKAIEEVEKVYPGTMEEAGGKNTVEKENTGGKETVGEKDSDNPGKAEEEKKTDNGEKDQSEEKIIIGNCDTARKNYIEQSIIIDSETGKTSRVDKVKNAAFNAIAGVRNIFSKNKIEYRKIENREDYIREKTKEAKKAYDQARVEVGNMMYQKEKSRLEKLGVSPAQLVKKLNQYQDDKIFRAIIIDEYKKTAILKEDSKYMNKNMGKKYTEEYYAERQILKKGLFYGREKLETPDLENYENSSRELDSERIEHVRNRVIRNRIVAAALFLIASYAAGSKIAERKEKVEKGDELKKKEAEAPTKKSEKPTLHIDASKFANREVTDEEVGNIDIDVNKIQNTSQEVIDTTNILKEGIPIPGEEKYLDEINKLFPDSAKNLNWQNVKVINPNVLFKLEKEDGLNEMYRPLAAYLHRLEEKTGIKPGETEQIQTYIKRALNK